MQMADAKMRILRLPLIGNLEQKDEIIGHVKVYIYFNYDFELEQRL